MMEATRLSEARHTLDCQVS